jgi:heme/copper-type cytochrome/quinol oxidase subunit 2
MEFSSLGKWLIFFGLFIAAIGILIWLAGKSGLPFGSLPGDIRVERPGFSFNFPLMTGIVISIVITVILNIVLWFFRR